MTRARLSAATAAAALVLSGCISVLPKQKPAQLYRFDAAAGGAADAPASGDGERVEVVAPPVSVSRASSTDQILAITGDQAAFIAGSRWVSPAAVLWDEALRRAFATRSGRVRLLGRAELAGGRAFLRLDVPEFEVRYPAPGAGASPAVRVTLHALYTHRNGLFSAERTFTASVPASEDRVSAIVAAFDRAVEATTTELLSWADAHADEAAAEPAASGASTFTGRSPSPPPRAPATRTTTTSTTSSHTVAPPPRP